MTIKEELYKIYNEYHNVESHEDAGVMIEFTEKNIAVITKKLDEKINSITDLELRLNVIGDFESIHKCVIIRDTLSDFKRELEK